jgi:hypothetical protein
MTNSEILDILNKVFVGSEIYSDPKAKFSPIDIRGCGLRFYTYSHDSSNPDCIWYCGIWIVNESKEVRIPNEMTKEFIEEIFEHSKNLNKINDKVSSISKRFDEMNSQDSIRDMKLKKILNDKNS